MHIVAREKALSALVTVSPCDQTPDKKHVREGGAITAGHLRVQPVMARKEQHGDWSHFSHSQEAQRDACWFSAHLLFFTQPRIPAHGMVVATLRVGCPTSVNSI